MMPWTRAFFEISHTSLWGMMVPLSVFSSAITRVGALNYSQSDVRVSFEPT